MDSNAYQPALDLFAPPPPAPPIDATPTPAVDPLLGAAVINPYGSIGYIVEVKESAGNVYVIAGGPKPMSRVRAEYVVAYENRLSELSDGIAAPMLARASHLPKAEISTLPELRAKAEAAQAIAREEHRREIDATEARRATFSEEVKRRAPAWAKAAIIAELVEDQSDSMTDYFGSTVKRTVVLAWSRHERDLFPEMRQAARRFPETAALADAPESAEHREKYSMGGGYYLKAGYRHNDGWRVKKRRLDWISCSNGEFLPDDEPAAPAPAASGTAMEVQRHYHSKRGCDFFLCVMSDRVERDEFDRLRDAAKAAGGWYSRAWGKTPGGFAFMAEADARAFAGADTPADDGEAAPAVAAPAIGDKLRGMADAMQSAIDDKFRDRLSNTPKRARQAAEARNDGQHYERAQSAMRALAALYDAGEVPAALAGVRTKAEILKLATSKIERSGGYYDAGFDTGEPYYSTPAAVALWELLRPNPERAKAEELRRKIASLQFANIPGYFPTPAAIVARMIEAADIPDGARVLEPSGGSGAILDGLRDACPSAELVTYETWCTLAEILEAKGYHVAGGDFLESSEPVASFDRVLMNPPFEGGQDVDHVRFAFDLLKPGGRLVAIMGAGVTFRRDAKFAGFRAWVDAMGGELQELPAGSFKESGTGVSAVMLTVDRD